MILHGWNDLDELKDDFFEYKYYDDENKSRKASADAEFEGVEILIGAYDIGCYEGQAWVLIRKDGNLFEVDANHCSCYGLENQWDPSIITKEELVIRLSKKDFGKLWPSGLNFREDLKKIVESL